MVLSYSGDSFLTVTLTVLAGTALATALLGARIHVVSQRSVARA